MAIGSHVISFDTAPDTTGFPSYGNFTVCEYGSVNATCVVRSIFYQPSGAGTVTAKPVIYNGSNVKVAEGTWTGYTGSTTQVIEMPLSSPYTLSPSTAYYIGHTVQVGTGGSTAARSISSSVNVASIPGHATWTPYNPGQYYATGDAFPSTYANFRTIGGFSFTPPNAAPNAPTNIAPNNTFADPRVPIRFSWTYSDPNGNPQTHLQLQWREKGVGTWTVGGQAASPNPYYDFPTGTFVLGRDYEWQVRVYDGMDWGAWSATGSFFAGTSLWNYSGVVSSSASTANIPTTGLTPGNYIYEVRTADSVGFGPYSATGTFVVTAGSYVPSVMM